MPLPVEIGYGTVRVDLQHGDELGTPALDGEPAQGFVTFTPSAAKLLDTAGDVIVVPRPITRPLDVNGQLTVQLIATDDPDLNPTDWTWRVSFSLVGASLEAWSFEVPEGSDRSLREISPMPDANGTFYLPGVPGPRGTSGEGVRVVTMGDSINAAGMFALHGTTWTDAFCGMSDQRCAFGGNTATGGETSTQIEARCPEALLLDPDIVTLTAGANDLAGGGTLGNFQTKMTSIADTMRNADVDLILTTIPPLPGSGGVLPATIDVWNAWLLDFAAARELTILDFHSLLTNGAGGYAPGYDSGDGIHPSQAAHVAMANMALAALAARDIGVVGPAIRRAIGGGNLIPDPILTDAPSGWLWTPAAGYVGTLVDDPEFRGKARRIVAAGAAGGLAQFNTTAPIPVTAGQHLLVCGANRVDVSTAAPASFKGLRFEAWWSGFPWVTPMVQGFVAQRPFSRWAYEVVVPAGVTSLTPVVLVNGITALEAFTCHVGEFTVYDITKERRF